MAKLLDNASTMGADRPGQVGTSADQRKIDAPLLRELLANLRLGLSPSVALALSPAIEGPRFWHEYRSEIRQARAEWRKRKHLDLEARVESFDDALKFMERKDPKEWASLEARSKARELDQPKQAPIQINVAQQAALQARLAEYEPLQLPSHAASAASTQVQEPENEHDDDTQDPIDPEPE